MKKKDDRIILIILLVLAAAVVTTCFIVASMPVERKASKANKYDLECVTQPNEKPLTSCKQ